MRVFGKNMVWFLKFVENGKGSVLEFVKELKVVINFIR